MEALLYLSDNLLEILGATRADTGAEINNASVTVTVVDHVTGANVGGVGWPLTVPAVGTGGDYRVTLPDTLAVTIGQKLRAKISFDGGAGLARYSELPIKVIVG